MSVGLCHPLTVKPPNGLEPLTCGLQNRCGESVTPETTDTYESDGKNLASCSALLREESPDLAMVIEVWDSLPEPVLAGVTAMVKAAQG